MNACMGTGKRLQILLSTYNGDKYLSQQLDSFLFQLGALEIQVLIRDDGSTDSTADILRAYQCVHGFEVEFGEHIGVNASYQWLIEHSSQDCDYFAFSDQDDVWFPNKTAQALEHLAGKNSEVPQLFAARSRITDEQLLPIGQSTLPIRGCSFYNAMVQNVLPGHTQVFNRALRDVLVVHDCLEALVVDWWLYLTASAVGEVTFSSECAVLHRQHTKNAVGYRLAFFPQLGQRLRALRQKKGNAISRQLAAFYYSWGGKISTEYVQELRAYLDSLDNFFTRAIYLRRSRVFRQKPLEDQLFRLLFLLGKYKLHKGEWRRG